MHFFLLAVHITACVLLVLSVLMTQAGRGAGLAIFGGGGDALFSSPSGSSFMRKLITTLAATFAVTSLLLTLLSGRVGMRSVTRGEAALPMEAQPQAPAQAPAKAAAKPAAKAPAAAQGAPKKPAGGK